jgi:hypothetical protein
VDQMAIILPSPTPVVNYSPLQKKEKREEEGQVRTLKECMISDGRSCKIWLELMIGITR